MKKRLLAVLLCIAVACDFASAVTVSALSDDEIVFYSEKLYDSDGAYLTDLTSAVDLNALHEYLRGEFAQCKSPIDISSYNIPKTLQTQLNTYIWKEMPESFHVKSLGESKNSSNLLAVYVDYREFCTTASDYENKMTECELAADKLLLGIPDDDSMSDVNKALLIHDRLALMCEYDYSFAIESYTMYGAFSAKTAVCEGYTKAYMYLLRKVGVDCRYCTSDALNHAWDIVTVDGAEYHVDVTWDDASWYKNGRGCIGRVTHDNFLRSTEGIKETKHTADDFDTSPCDTRYDNAFWQNSQAAFLLLDGSIYCLDNKNQKLMRYYPDQAELCDISDIWTAGGGYYWTENYSRLASDGFALYYSTAAKVYRYDVTANSSAAVFEPALAADCSIYGFDYEEGNIICDVNTTPPYGGDYTALDQITYAYEYMPDCEHVWNGGVVTAAPTCVSAGVMTYKCTVCGRTKTEETEIDPGAHVWSEAVYVWADGHSACTAVRVCSNSAAHTETETADSTSSVTAVATCEGRGRATYTAVFVNTAFEEQIIEAETAALGHDWGEWDIISSATCERSGTQARICKNDPDHVETRDIQPKGHDWGEWVYNNDATLEKDGTKTRVCKRNSNHVETVTAEGTRLSPTAVFKDVAAGAFYETAVNWAVAYGVTSGTTATTFSPNKICTRGQVVTFLWRAAGSPGIKNKTNPFTDVKDGAFYYDAVLWAVENGVTAGLTATTFGPGKECTRGQVVTFLWRARGKPAATQTGCPFTDVSANGFYFDAMLWAVENGVTNGTTATAFGPGKACTRGQVVTFLYRAFQ